MSRLFIGFFMAFIVLPSLAMAQRSFEDGVNLLKKGEIQQAKSILLEYKEKEEAIDLLGDIASFNKNWDKAIEYYRDLVDRNHNSAEYNFKLGGALGMKALEGSKFQAALLVPEMKKSLLTAAELDPQHAEVRRALVEFYMQIPSFLGGGKNAAMEYVEELEEINKVEAHLARAYIYKIEKDSEAVKEEIGEAITVAVSNPGLVTRNHVNYELGERAAGLNIYPDKASGFLERYIADYGYKDLESPAFAYLHLARIKASQNNREEALKNINLALNHKVIFPEAEKEKMRILQM
ncbi:MAG: tetratricopeptide repeat protein [Bacteroidota bacterium]